MERFDSLFENYPIEFKEINPEDFTKNFNPDGTTSDRSVFTVENDEEKIVKNQIREVL